jgi:hypothetical protein
MRMLFSIFVITLLVAGCQYDPYAHLLTTSEPKQEDVVGSYELTQQNIVSGDLEFLQGRRCVLDLHSDGTFSITNYPFWSEAFSMTNSKLKSFISQTGRWSCAEVGGVSDGKTYKRNWGIQFSNTTTNLDSLALTGQAPPYGLIMTYGDPDSGTVMIFERKK